MRQPPSQKGGGRGPPPFWMLLKLPGTAQTSKMTDFPYPFWLKQFVLGALPHPCFRRPSASSSRPTCHGVAVRRGRRIRTAATAARDRPVAEEVGRLPLLPHGRVGVAGSSTRRIVGAASFASGGSCRRLMRRRTVQRRPVHRTGSAALAISRGTLARGTAATAVAWHVRRWGMLRRRVRAVLLGRQAPL